MEDKEVRGRLRMANGLDSIAFTRESGLERDL